MNTFSVSNLVSLGTLVIYFDTIEGTENSGRLPVLFSLCILLQSLYISVPKIFYKLRKLVNFLSVNIQ